MKLKEGLLTRVGELVFPVLVTVFLTSLLLISWVEYYQEPNAVVIFELFQTPSFWATILIGTLTLYFAYCQKQYAIEQKKIAHGNLALSLLKERIRLHREFREAYAPYDTILIKGTFENTDNVMNEFRDYLYLHLTEMHALFGSDCKDLAIELMKLVGDVNLLRFEFSCSGGQIPFPKGCTARTQLFDVKKKMTCLQDQKVWDELSEKHEYSRGIANKIMIVMYRKLLLLNQIPESLY